MSGDPWPMIVLKMLCAVLYVLAVFAGLPLLLVGTGWLIVHWLGSAWWVGLILAPVGLAEFIGGVSFVMSEKNPIPSWLSSN